jgi:hypothetical protein
MEGSFTKRTSGEQVTVDQLSWTPEGKLRFRDQWKIEGGAQAKMPAGLRIAASFLDQQGQEIGAKAESIFVLSERFKASESDQCETIVTVPVPAGARYMNVQLAKMKDLRIESIPLPKH